MLILPKFGLKIKIQTHFMKKIHQIFRHIGAAETLCTCPPGFKGDKCQYSDIDSVTGKYK